MNNNLEAKILNLYNSGLVLVAIRPIGDKPTKGPRALGWNKEKTSSNPEGFCLNPSELPIGKNINYGLLHSESHTIAIDFDDMSVCKSLLLDVAGVDVDALFNAHNKFQIKSPKSNRGKLVYLLPDGVIVDSVKKYARQINGKMESIFELRAGPNQDVILGSHPEGGEYEIIGDPNNIPEVPEAFLNMALYWDAWKPVIDSFFGIISLPQQKINNHTDQVHPACVEFNAKNNIRDVLERNGYKPVGKNRYIRPGSSSGAPGLVLYDDGKVYSWGADDLANGHSHDAFNCYKILECSGDFKTALNKMGFKGDVNFKKEKQVEQKVEEEKHIVERKWLDADDMADNAKAPVYLINKILEANTHGLIAGSSSSLKSFCVLKMAHSICTGEPFFANDVFDTGKVIYICGEGGQGIERRLKAIKITEGGFNHNLKVLERPLFIDNIAEIEWLKNELKIFNPVLVIFDTFSTLATSTKENANEEVANVLALVAGCCREVGASSIIVHHYGKVIESGSRGASAFSANVDFEICMKRVPDTLEAVMSCKKSKDGDYFKDINIKAHVVDLGLVMQDGTNSTSLVLKDGDSAVKLSSRQERIVDIIGNLIKTEGIQNVNRMVVTERQIKDALNTEYESDGKYKYKVFGNVIPRLVKRNILGQDGDKYWIFDMLCHTYD